MAGQVIAAADVAAADAGDGILAARETLACPELAQRVLRCGPGRAAARETGEAEEVLYVLAGAGILHAAGVEHPLAPGAGVRVGPGESYALEGAGPDPLELVSVSIPDPPPGELPRAAAVSRTEQETGQATADREFRLLAPAAGATAFVGMIPPGRAPEHYHRYDELIYILAGDGVLHLPDGDERVGPGSCIHLPRELRHSLENAGQAPLEVYGVFRPAGSPSEAYYPDGTPAMTVGPGDPPR